MHLEFTSLGHGYSPAHWNARVTHEVQWIILVMEMCCRRYGACQSCFCSASLGQLELVFAAIPLEWTGLSILCSILRVKKKFKYKLHLQSWDFFRFPEWHMKAFLWFFSIIIILLGVFWFFCFKARSIICTINSKVLYQFPANLRFSAVIFLWFHGIWGLECSNLDVLYQEKALSASRVFITSNLNCILDFLEEKKSIRDCREENEPFP